MNKIAKDWVEAIAFAAIACLILYFICWPYKINNDSMEQSLYSNDRIVASRVASSFGNIKPGDMVVCKVEIDEKKVSLIKRVIGLPGDRVKISKDKVYLNDIELNEAYLGNTITEGKVDIILGDYEYFILGDNRAMSIDSRSFGPITKNDIQGKVIARWFPVKSFEVY